MPEDLTSLEEEVGKDPLKGRFYELARKYQRLGRLDDAARICEEGLATNATRWQARILLAQLCVARGDFEEAGAQVQKVLLALPDNVPANHLAADIFYVRGDHEKALKHYKIVQLFEPGIQQVEERITKLESATSTAAAVETVVSDTASHDSKETDESVKETVTVESALLIKQEEAPEEVEEHEIDIASATDIDEGGDSVDTASSWEVEEEAGARESETGESDIFVEEQDGEDLEAVLTEDTDENWEDTRDSLSFSDEKKPAEPVEEEEEVDLSEDAGEELDDKVDRLSDVSFGTNTLAEMYEEQGYPEKAIEVYQRMLLKDPENRQVLDVIERLKQKVIGDTVDTPSVENADVKRAIRQKRINILEAWLNSLRGRADV